MEKHVLKAIEDLHEELHTVAVQVATHSVKINIILAVLGTLGISIIPAIGYLVIQWVNHN